MYTKRKERGWGLVSVRATIQDETTIQEYIRKMALSDELFYHTVIESALFYAVVCWGSCTTGKNCNCRRLDKLVKKASSVVGRKLDPLIAVVEQRMRRKLYSVLDNNKHPLHSILARQRSRCSERLISLRCRTERFRRSFLRTAIRLFNSDC